MSDAKTNTPKEQKPETKKPVSPFGRVSPSDIDPVAFGDAMAEFGFGEKWTPPGRLEVPDVYRAKYPWAGFRWCHPLTMRAYPERGLRTVPKIEGDGLAPAPDGTVRHGDLILHMMPLTHQEERTAFHQRNSKALVDGIRKGAHIARTIRAFADQYGDEVVEAFAVMASSGPMARDMVRQARRGEGQAGARHASRGWGQDIYREMQRMDKDQLQELADSADKSGLTGVLDLDNLDKNKD